MGRRARAVGVAAVGLLTSSWSVASGAPLITATVEVGDGSSVSIKVASEPTASLLEQAVGRVRAEGRGLDQATNPDYLARVAPLVAPYLDGSDTESIRFDPFRTGWAGRRGEHRRVTYPNRYGAEIVADLYSPRLPYRDPVTGLQTRGPFPALVLVPGGGTRGDAYEGVAQSLAESGYVVLAFDPQGQGRSATDPAPEFCEPDGSWREPQEAGLQELGSCAGTASLPRFEHPLSAVSDPLLGTPAGPALDTVGFLSLNHIDRTAMLQQINEAYRWVGPNFAFGALDAHDFLVSDANPLRPLVDEARVGVLGHSLGAWGAVTAANGDEARRFAAAAGFDGFASPPVAPSVPTLFLVAEGLDTDVPIPPDADPEQHHPWSGAGLRWHSSGMASMQVSLRSATHQEWYAIPFALANPIVGPLQNASSLGERISVHYLLAWFDLHLKGATHGSDALDRLVAREFDGSADASSIGQGRYDLVRRANRPYTIAGTTVSAQLSRLYPSRYFLGGSRCDDLVAGCAHPRR